MPNIRMPSGIVVSFPDDLPRSEIVKAIETDKVRVQKEEEERRQQEIQKKRDEVGIAGAFGRGLSRGITTTAGLIGDVIPAMVGQAVGADEYRDRQMQEYIERMKKMDEERPSLVPTYKDIDGVGDLAKYSLETIGQFVPSVATSIAGGGIGGFLGQTVAKQGAKKLLDAGAKEAAAKFAKSAVTKGQIGGAFAGSGIQTIPEAYATLEQETGDPQLTASLIVGSANAALDSILPAAFLTRLGKDGRDQVARGIVAQTIQRLGTTTGKTRGSTVLKSALKSGVIEGLTEGLQATNQTLAARILDENPEFWQSGDFTQILDATIRGAIGGKAFGAGTGFFTKTETQKQLEADQEKDDNLVSALEIVQSAGGMQKMLQLEYKPEDTRDSDHVAKLKKDKSLPKSIKEILKSDTLTDEQKVRRIEFIKRKIEEQDQPKTKGEKASEQFMRDKGISEELIESGKVIQLGDKTPELLQIEFDPNATNSEEELKRIRKQASIDLKGSHPIKKILDNPNISTPKKLEIFKKFQERERQRLDVKSEFEKEQEKIDEVAGFEVTDKDIQLGDDRPTTYHIVDKKGKRVKVAPFSEIVEAEQWVQEQKNPEKFSIVDQKDDVVYKGQPYTPLKRIIKGQKQRGISPEEAKINILTGRKDTDFSEREAQDSVKQPFADEVGDTLEVAKPTIAQDSQLFLDAVDTINNRIDEIESRGEIGKQTSIALREVVNDSRNTVGEMSAAFEVGEILTKILPKEVGHEVFFLDTLKKGKTEGLTNNAEKLLSFAFRTSQKRDGQSSLVFDQKTMEETASHEAFHVLQDLYIKYDPKAKAILENEFGSAMRQGERVKYETSSTAKWMQRINPKLHDQLTKISQKQNGITGREMQAYAFSAYYQARKEGKAPVLKSGLARYFNFVQQFIERMGNVLRGYGFQSAQDVFDTYASGAGAKSVSNRTVSERSIDPEDINDVDFSSRAAEGELLTSPDGQPFITDIRKSSRLVPLNNGSTTIAKYQKRKTDKKKNVVMPVGERYWEVRKERFDGYGQSIVMHPSNINSIKQNTPHNSVVSFVQDVVANGKKREIGDRVYFTYRTPEYKQTANVVLEQDRKNPSNLNIINAYARDDKAIQRQKVNEQLEADRKRKQQMLDMDATTQDIEAYRRGDFDYSERGGDPLEGDRISTAVPSSEGKRVYRDGVKDETFKVKDPLTDNIQVSLAEIKFTPEANTKSPSLLDKHVGTFKTYRMDKRSGGYNIVTPTEAQYDTERFIDTFLNRMVDNLIYIYNLVPDNIRQRSKLWYDGANFISRKSADKYGVEVRQAAGIFASLSPQKDWFQNVSLGLRIMDIMNQRGDYVFDENMEKWMESYIEKMEAELEKSPSKRKEIGLKKAKEIYKNIKGKTINQLDQIVEKAYILRAFDETYHDKSYNIVTPEGNFLGLAKNQDGSNSSMAWGGFDTIGAAIGIYLDGSRENISNTLSSEHKVRSFYNNILAPNSDAMDVTADTHAVSANLLKPLGGKALQVGHNFGVLDAQWTKKDGYSGAGSSGFTGMSGTYGIHADAYRIAAEKLGNVVLPREMQSITWEAIRTIFTDTFKSNANNLDQNFEIWNKFDGTNLQQIQNEIVEAAGGYQLPEWAREGENEQGDTRLPEITKYAVNEGQLSSDSVSELGGRQPAGRTRSFPTRADQEKRLRAEGFFGQDVDESSRNVEVNDSLYENVEFKRLQTQKDGPPSLVNSGFQNTANFKNKKFKNRLLEQGKRVSLRPNLLGIIKLEPKGMVLTYSVHDKKVKGSVLGYDYLTSVSGEFDFDVNQKDRADIALGVDTKGKKVDKFPMAGVNGGYNQLTPEQMQEVINNPDHVIKFNPKQYHLFYEEVEMDGRVRNLAVKSGNGVVVPYNTSIYVKGDVEYWKQDEAPTPVRDAETKVRYVDGPDTDESSRGFAQSWDDVLVKKEDGMINTFLQGLKRIYSSRDGFVQEFINSTEPIGDLEEDVKFSEEGIRRRMSVAEGAQRFMEMAMNSAGRNEMIMKYGAPVMAADGTPSFDPDSKGIFQIFENFTIEEYNGFVKYASARRAQVLGEKERFISQDLINDGLSLENDKYKQAFEEYQQFNKKLLSFLAESGIIDQKQRNNLSKYDYIPFYRAIEEDTYAGGRLFKQDIRGPNTSNVLNNPKKQIMEYSGGQKPIGDLVENMFRNAQALIDSAMKNKAMEKAVNLMMRADVGKRVTAKEASDIRQTKGGRVISFRKNVRLTDGSIVNRKIEYDISEAPHLYVSLAAMTPRQTDGLFRLMENIGKIFREGITHAPPFMIANLIRGDMAAFVTVDAPLTPFFDTLKGMQNALNETETIKEMKLISGVGGYAMGDDYRDSARILKRQMRQRHRGYNIVSDTQGVTDLVKASWGQLTKLGEATELATREGIYRKLVDSGMSKADAAYEALNVINFNRRGAAQTNLGIFVNSLLPLVPFLNARFQGLYRTFEPMTTGKQADRSKTIGKGLLLFGANMALYSLMSQDDRWKDEPLHRRLAYHIIYPNMIGMEGVLGREPLLIPRAFEIGAIFTSLPELFIDGIRENDGDYIADGVLHTLINTFSFTPIPQAMIPAIEVATNYDFFTGRNLDTDSQKRYIKSERTSPTTLETSRLLSKASQDTLSPNQVTQLIEGYLGSMGGYMLGAMDILASGLGLIPTRPTGVFGSSIPAQFAEGLGFGRFRKPDPDPSSKAIGDFYEIKSFTSQIQSTINKLVREGRIEEAKKLFEKNKKYLKYKSPINNIDEKLRKINRYIGMVQLDKKLTGDQKNKKLEVAFTQRKNLSQQINKILRAIREQ
tara:strand:+ start:2421 stop:10817 length:8397 start_codon:yes stop_codon:yes gene_type:complete